MTSRAVPSILHGATLGAMLAAYSAPIQLHIISADQFGGLSQFLTIHGLFVAMATIFVSLLLDLFPRSTGLRSVKRVLLLVGMPISAVVSSIYWTLLLAFPSLIMPPTVPGGITVPTSSSDLPPTLELLHIPLHVDLGLHALPGLALVVDFMVLENKFSRKVASTYALPVSILVTLCYTSWTEYCASINGVFPYPFLNNPVEIRLAIYAGATAIAYGSFRLLNALHP